MERNILALILVVLLLVILSFPVFSDQERCEGTYEFALGMGEGVMGSSWGWGLLGFVITVTGGIGGTALGWRMTGGWTDEAKWIPFALIGAGIGTIVSLTLPYASKPQPVLIPGNISEKNRECYLDGYGWGARRKSTNSALIGCAVGWGFNIIVIPVVMAGLYLQDLTHSPDWSGW